MVAEAHKRSLFTRGSNCKALTKKILVFSKAVAYGRWSYMEVRLNLENPTNGTG